jgi:hypothetical protein
LNRPVNRIFFFMLLIAALAVIWNLLGIDLLIQNPA